MTSPLAQGNRGKSLGKLAHKEIILNIARLDHAALKYCVILNLLSAKRRIFLHLVLKHRQQLTPF
jgi:hypothetical protein